MAALLLLLLLPLPAAPVGPDLEGLRMVHLVFRHGDRAPIDPFPTDTHRSSWPMGLGQLTGEGKVQQLELGRWVRARYTGFLGPAYTPGEVYVRSTDVDRTLMSAEAHLAGLFPPSGPQLFDPSLPWQPVPVHTVPQAEDALLSSHAACPRFDQLQKEVEEGPVMRAIYMENKQLFEYISTQAGLNVTNVVQLDYIYDTLLCETIHNMTLSPWTESIFPASPARPLSMKFKELRDLSFTVDTFTPELRRLKGGPFLQLLVDHFQAEAGHQTGLKKLYMYSGHDTTVAPILDTMRVFNGMAPPYASMVIVELLERPGGLHVRVSYKNTSDTALPLQLPGCPVLCPLETFTALTASARPVDWRAECRLPALADPVVQRVTLLAAGASSLLALTVLGAVLVLLCRGRRAGPASLGVRYQPVGQADDI